MELMASKTLSWARKDNLLNKTLSPLKCAHQKASTGYWGIPDEMQAEQNTAAHMGSIPQARDPDSILRALKVSCTEGEKKPMAGK